MTEAAGSASLQVVDAETVRVEGDLTFQTVTGVLKQAAPVLESGDGPLAFDFAGLRRSDSTALALLLELIRRGRRRNRRVVYRNLPERLLQLAKISDLDGVISTAG